MTVVSGEVMMSSGRPRRTTRRLVCCTNLCGGWLWTRSAAGAAAGLSWWDA